MTSLKFPENVVTVRKDKICAHLNPHNRNLRMQLKTKAC